MFTQINLYNYVNYNRKTLFHLYMIFDDVCTQNTAVNLCVTIKISCEETILFVSIFCYVIFSSSY